MSNYFKAAMLVTALLSTQSVCFADEVNTSTIKVTTPVVESKTEIETQSDGINKSAEVKSTTKTPREKSSSTFKARAGAAGSKVSSSQSNVRANEDGSVSANEKKESHDVNVAGSTHKKSESSQTVDTDGSTTSVKEESTETSPN